MDLEYCSNVPDTSTGINKHLIPQKDNIPVLLFLLLLRSRHPNPDMQTAANKPLPSVRPHLGPSFALVRPGEVVIIRRAP